MTEKKCSNCFQVKPISEFYRKCDRHQSRCKSCNAEVCFVYRNRLRPKKIEAYLERKEEA
jgi:hypothetical protein